ncbi:MAG: DUF4340 domain-containing protein [Terriglobia bacterium]
MKWKNLGFLAALFALLMAYVYFFEIKGEKKKEEAEEKAKKLFQFEEKEIAQIDLKNADGVVTLQRENDLWKLSRPIEAKADKSACDALANSLVGTKVDRTLDDANLNWKNFGLDPAPVRITVKLKDGKIHDLELGEKDFSSSSLFARVPGQNKVLLLASTGLLSDASKKLLEFRDKSVLEFERGQLKGFTIARKDKEFRFEKSGDDWFIKKPFEGRGDNSEINSVVSDLEFAKVEDFVNPPLDDLKKYGLVKPQVRVDLFVGENKNRKSLLIGDKVDNSYYAKDDSREAVFKVKEDLFKKLDVDSQKIRDKKLVRVDRSNLKEIDVKLGDKFFAFTRGSEDKWKWIKPEGNEQKNLLDYKIFWPIEDLEGKELIDNANLKDPKYGFDAPLAEIILKEKNDKSTEVILGKVENDRVYGVVKGSAIVYKIDKKILESLNFKADEIVEKQEKPAS